MRTSRKFLHPIARPVLKWAGGKGRILTDLTDRIPPAFLQRIRTGESRYFEPFAGGAALFFHLEPKDAVLADTNPYLCELYRQLHPDSYGIGAIIRQLQRHKAQHTKNEKRHYYDVRAQFNTYGPQWRMTHKLAAWFIYLNKTCFNGLYRVNKRGEFNVPIGKYADPNICDPSALRAASAVLEHAEILCADYYTALASAKEGDVVYLDPPYDPIDATSNFTGYSAAGFSRADQKRLAEHALSLAQRGVFVMLSNNDTKYVRSLYREHFNIRRVKVGRSVSSKITERASIYEVIITSKPQDQLGGSSRDERGYDRRDPGGTISPKKKKKSKKSSRRKVRAR